MDTRTTRSWAWALAAVVAGGAALRLTGIGAESVDLEEYACTGALHVHGLRHFLAEQRALYPYGAPGVPLLYYLWAALFGDAIVAVRLLSALTGTALLLLLPPLAREIWPDDPKTARSAGFVAVLCAALSPVCLFQAQEARMYAFVAFFAALSSLSLLRAARTGRRRWWAVNIAANGALVWCHYFAAFLWPAQGLWLLCAAGVRWRTRCRWLAATALLLVPVAGWMSGIAPQPSELYDSYIMPDPGAVACNLVAGDAVYWSSSSYFPSDRAWFFAPAGVGRALVAAHPAGGALIAGTFAMALLWGVACLFRGRAAGTARTGYLLLWALVPVALLVALSFAWKPIYASRYVTHGALALYLLLGGLMARLPRRSRAAAVVLLAAVYLWQLSLVLPPQTRTAWKQTEKTIQAADGNAAIALVQGVFWKPVFEANLGQSDRLVTGVLEPETMAGMSAFLVKRIPVLEPGGTPACWVVLVDAIHGQAERFEAAIAPEGAAFEKTAFPGERKLIVYRVSPVSPAAGEVIAAPPEALLGLARAIGGHGDDPRVAAFLDRVRTRHDKEGGGYLRLGVELARRGRAALAAAALDEALALFPAHLVDLVLLQRELGGNGDFSPLADRAFERIKAFPDRIPALRQVLQSLLEAGQIDGMRDIARRMIAAFPDYPEGYAYLGNQDHTDRRHDEAFANLERAVRLDPMQPAHIYNALGDEYIRLGRCADAVRLLEQALSHEPPDCLLMLKLADAHIACGEPAKALPLVAAVLKREPNSFEPHRSRAEALLMLGNLDEAEPEIALLLQKDPANPSFNIMMWRIFSYRGRDAEARQLIQKLAETSPELGAFFLPLIDGLYVRHDRAPVLAAFSKGAPGAPVPADVMKTLDRLCPENQPPAAAGGTGS